MTTSATARPSRRRHARSMRARPAARRPSGTRPSRSSCARSAAPSRRTRSIRDRRDRGDRSRQGAARAAGGAARLADRAAQRAVPELPRGDGVRSGARRPELRVLRVAGAGGLPRDQGADPPAEPAAVQGHRHARCARDPALVREQVVRAGRAEAPCARRHGARPLHPVLDLRRAACTARGAPRRGTTTTRPRRYRDSRGAPQTRQVRHVRWEPASGVVDHFFDDEPVPGTQGVEHRLCCERVEPFPTTDLVPYDTALLSGFVVEHYQVVLIDAAQRSIDQMTEQLEALCAAAGPRRHLPRARDLPRVLRPDLQAHPRAGLAADVHLRRAQDVSRCW